MPEHIGSVYVNVLPDDSGFVTRMKSQILPQMGQFGDEAGQAFVRGFRGPVERDLPDVFRRSRPSTNRESQKSGKDAGDAFGRELDARVGAAIKALPDINVGADISAAEAKIAEIRATLLGIGDERLGIRLSDTENLDNIAVLKAQLEELTGPEHDVRVRLDAKAAVAELAALQASIAALDKEDVEPKIAGEIDNIGNSADRSNRKIRPLLDSIVILGPALIPIAGAALAAGAGFAGMGLAGIAAFKGIKTEIDAGTRLGIGYQAQLNQVKGTAAQIEQVAARSVRGSFQQAIDKLEAAGPQLRAGVGHLAAETGDIAQHLVGGLVSGFQTFEPLMEHVLALVDRGAARFEAWATGPGGAKFAAALAEDFDKAVPVLGQIVELSGRLLASLNGTGLGTLSVVGLLAKDLNALPLPVLTTLLQTIIALRVAAVVATGVEKLAGAVAALRLASSGGGGGGGGEGALAGIVRFAKPAAVGVLAVVGATALANNATKQWETSSNILARSINSTTKAAKDLFTAPSHIAGDLTGRHLDQLNQEVKDIYKTAHDGIVLQQQYAASVNSTPGRPPASIARPIAIVNPVEIERLSVINARVGQLTAALARLHAVTASAPISGAVSAFDQLNSSLSQSVDGIYKFLNLGGKQVGLYHGMAIGEKTWQSAMAQSNGDKNKAVGLVESQIDLYGRYVNELGRTAGQEQLLNKYVGDAEAKYGITADQVDLYTQVLGLNADQIDKSASAEARAQKALGQVVHQLQNGNEALQGWLAAVAQSAQGANTLTSRADLLAAGLTALRGVTLSMATTNLSAVSAAEAASAAIHDNSASISKNGTLLGQLTKQGKTWVVTQPQLTAGSVAISSAMNQAATSAVDLARSIYANTGNANQAFSAFEGLRSQFVATQIQSGLSAGAAENLARQIFGIPKDAKTFVALLGKNDVAGAIRDLTGQLAHFSKIISRAFLGVDDHASGPLRNIHDIFNNIPNSKVIDITVNQSVGKAVHDAVNSLHPASGGAIIGAGTGTSDSIPAMVSNGEHMLTASDVQKAGGQAAVYRMRAAIQRGVLKFAAGGGVPSLYVPDPTASSGSSSSSNAPTPSETRAAASKAATLAKLKIVIDTTDISKFLHSLSGSASSIASAERTLANAVTKAGGGSALGRELAHENNSLLDLAKHRTGIANKLKDANTKLSAIQKQYNDERTSVASAVTGGFDITQAGFTQGQIQANADKAVAIAQLVKTQVDKLRTLGLNKNTLAGLAGKGLDAEPTLAVLAGETSAQIAQLNASGAKLSSLGNTIGTQEADSLYRAGVNAAHGLVDGLKSQEAAIAKQMKRIADVMVTEIRKHLKIHSPSLVTRELGQFVGEGLAAGMGDAHPSVRFAATRLAGAAVPDLTDQRGRSAARDGNIFNIGPISQRPNESSSELADRLGNRLDFALSSSG